MTETLTPEQRARLELMCDPAQIKWDLSPNDVSAIAAALATIAAQREEIERLKAHITEANATPHAQQLAEHQATICEQANRIAALEAENAALREFALQAAECVDPVFSAWGTQPTPDWVRAAMALRKEGE